MRIHTLGVFGARPGSGNPALVIEEDGLDTAARQAFARERGTTCVFLDAGAVPASVDFFYPHMRSPLCVHATLAAAAVLFARAPEPDGRLAVTTALHGQRIELLRDGDGFYAGLRPQPAPEPSGEALAAAIDALGCAPAPPPRVASVGSPKLLMEVGSEAVLHALAPDLPAVAAWGRAHGVNGVYAYCRRDDGDVEGRNFNHLEPGLEDSATGVAAGALTALLGHGIALRQGRATGRDCLIQTRLEDGLVYVGGAVERL